MLDRFRAAGVRISIDDFGTGRSSRALLKQGRGSELKIIGSLIMYATESQRDAIQGGRIAKPQLLNELPAKLAPMTRNAVTC